MSQASEKTLRGEAATVKKPKSKLSKGDHLVQIGRERAEAGVGAGKGAAAETTRQLGVQSDIIDELYDAESGHILGDDEICAAQFAYSKVLAAMRESESH
jgi:hypothetical protein